VACYRENFTGRTEADIEECAVTSNYFSL
jgi:hypothetical protein